MIQLILQQLEDQEKDDENPTNSSNETSEEDSAGLSPDDQGNKNDDNAESKAIAHADDPVQYLQQMLELEEELRENAVQTNNAITELMYLNHAVPKILKDKQIEYREMIQELHLERIYLKWQQWTPLAVATHYESQQLETLVDIEGLHIEGLHLKTPHIYDEISKQKYFKTLRKNTKLINKCYCIATAADILNCSNRTNNSTEVSNSKAIFLAYCFNECCNQLTFL